MAETRRSIYRAEAVRRYLQSREVSVLPRFTSPPTQICLWFLLGVLVMGMFVTWLAHVPVYSSGRAVVVEQAGSGQTVASDVLIIAFLSAEDLGRLRVGQNLYVDLDGRGERRRTPILAVEPEVSSPDAARKLVMSSRDAGPIITRPSVVAFAALDPSPVGLPAASYVGSIYQVDVQVGSRRVISLFPILDQVFGE